MMQRPRWISSFRPGYIILGPGVIFKWILSTSAWVGHAEIRAESAYVKYVMV